MFDLEGKTAWVTGSARNLGKAMADDLAAQGSAVVVNNKSNTDELENTVAELRDRHNTTILGVQGDVSEPSAVQSMVEEIEDEVGTVDILVNNAAIRPHQTIDEITIDDWDRVLETNLRGPYLCMKAVLPEMKDKGWGRIVSISGVDAYLGRTVRLHGVSSKAGIIGMTRALAQELAEYGITSNCIVPGVFQTERKEKWYPKLEAIYEVVEQRTPLERLGQPEELSPAVVFLASDEASFITGQVLHVNGGLYPTVRDPEALVNSDFSV